MSGKTGFKGFHALVLGFVLVCSLVPAQVSGQVVVSGEITGIVTDTTGAAVPGATLSATNVATNVVTETLTNEAGLYRILSLIPGTYSISAVRTGFKKFVRENVVINVGTVVRVDPILDLGEVSETVTVTGAAPMLKTDTVDVSQILNRRQIQDLPDPGSQRHPPRTVGTGCDHGNQPT